MVIYDDEYDEPDPYEGPLTGKRVTVDGYRGIAWNAYDYLDGQVNCVMVGDDRDFYFDPDDVTELPEDTPVCSCGQLGCHAEV
jgi:hypothetical protein